MEKIRQEKPIAPLACDARYGSDIAAGALRLIGVPYLALTPGASFRGLHDSIVNYLGNTAPQLLLVIHEETAVAIAHGFAKVGGEMMGAVLHANVGLMHATMSIFNAWCDRVPMIIIGANGPMDAVRRRPWIDWIHSSADQAALIRDFIKWDDQPASIEAIPEAVIRAAQIARTAPCGPTYVTLDVSFQEAVLAAKPAAALDLKRYAPPPPAAPAEPPLKAAAAALSGAANPVIMMGRVGRSEVAWAQRLALAEKLDAQVICDLRNGACFPTQHPLLGAVPDYLLSEQGLSVIRAADVILALDWVDLGGALLQAFPATERPPIIIHASLDGTLHRGWSKDHGSLPPIDHYLYCDPSEAVVALLSSVTKREPKRGRKSGAMMASPKRVPVGLAMTIEHIAEAINLITNGRDISLVRLPLSWSGAFGHFTHPLDYLGYDGGAGIGSGPGMAIGSALALKDSGRTAVAILGDGDFMMNCSAVWSAAHYKIPVLFASSPIIEASIMTRRIRSESPVIADGRSRTSGLGSPWPIRISTLPQLAARRELTELAR